HHYFFNSGNYFFNPAIPASASRNHPSRSGDAGNARAVSFALVYASRAPLASPVFDSASPNASWFGGYPGRNPTARRAASTPASGSPGPSGHPGARTNTSAFTRAGPALS